MKAKLRRSQLITTWGPGALLDLPEDAAIISGLERWPLRKMQEAGEIEEPRLTAKLAAMMRLPNAQLYSPPIDPDGQPWKRPPGVTVYRFPEWFVVREDTARKSSPQLPLSRPSPRARRLVHKAELDERSRFEGRNVVPTRFVRACPRGHVTDLNWRNFTHRGKDQTCRRQLWLDESGTSGDIGNLTVRCECGASRPMFDATLHRERTLGPCGGERPWLGANSREACDEGARLLIRTATNAYFPQVVSTLSLPNRGTDAEKAIRSQWATLQNATSAALVEAARTLNPAVGNAIAAFTDSEVMEAIQNIRGGGSDDRPVKLVELDAILSAPEGYGDDVPVDPNFHARRLPQEMWQNVPAAHKLSGVVQLHRLRIVSALAGFTRFEAETPNIHGEYDTDVKRASIALEPHWFPAIEIRGEGIFVQLSPEAIQEWRHRPAVMERIRQLEHGHELWLQKRQRQGEYPGAAYLLLHTLSHLLMQSLALHAGYPASSIAERVYADDDRQRYGILLYTGSNDADGTLGGLVAQAKQIGIRLEEALRSAALCSNDPICAQYTPDQLYEDRWLHGAACHGCALVSETSCEMRNDHLDRSLVVPTLGIDPSTAFFDLP